MPTDSDADDRSDMEALVGGEDLALNRIMGRHREKIFHYLIRLLQDEQEALDLAQETFVRVYVSRHKFKLENRFTSWMYAIATNLARDRVRWLARHRNVSLEAPVGSSEGTLADSLKETRLPPNESLEREERVNQVKAALSEIPEELRTPLVMVEYEGMSQAEIAAILNCKPKAVENRLYRARKLLREKLSRVFTAA